MILCQYYYHFLIASSLWIVVDSETWPQAMHGKVKIRRPRKPQGKESFETVITSLGITEGLLWSDVTEEKQTYRCSQNNFMKSVMMVFDLPAEPVNIIHWRKRKPNFDHKAKEERMWITYSV